MALSFLSKHMDRPFYFYLSCFTRCLG